MSAFAAVSLALALAFVPPAVAPAVAQEGGPDKGDGSDQPAPPPVDLNALVPQTVPPGYTPLPDQPDRLGPLHAAAAAAVLDQSGRVTAAMLEEAGFVNGLSKAWSKGDSGDVVITVLLEFTDQPRAEAFLGGFLEGRRKTTKPFPIPGVPEAAGFERGPPTPDRTMPAQREVVMQRGRVLAIVVVAGFQTYPPIEPAITMAEAQRAALASVPVQRRVREDERPSGWLGVAALLFVVDLFLLAGVARRYPEAFNKIVP